MTADDFLDWLGPWAPFVVLVGVVCAGYVLASFFDGDDE